MKTVIITISLVFASFTPLFASTCPEDWKQIQTADKSYCMEMTKTKNVKAHEAALICEEKKAKVCTTEQWMSACEMGLISTGQWEWSISLDVYTSIVGNNSCQDVAFGDLSPVANLRCCK